MSDKKPNILIIPIDNRPVCYDLPKQAAEIFEGVNVFMPHISLLGGLNKDADVPEIFEWVKKTIKTNSIDIAILALDTIAYGGLIPSRRTSLSYDAVKNNIDEFFEILKSTNSETKIYAFSSIMRISNNNINEEEKSYWDKYGRDIFKYSYLAHKLLRDYDVELEAEMIKLAKSIPFEVIDDYLETRKRNFDINSYYIDMLKEEKIDRIVFSQDDAAEFGFNIEEKELLWKRAVKEVVFPKVTIKSGADEMTVSLLSLALSDYFGKKIDISPVFFNENSKNIVSRYEDVPIEKSVNETIELCGGSISSDAKINLLVNTPISSQDDLCIGIYKDKSSVKQAAQLVDFVENSKSKFAIADIKNANGADNNLFPKLFEVNYNASKFYGYGAWNTTGNTLGTVIAVAIIKELAIKQDCYSDSAFKKFQYIRFVDDWAYQANIRKILRSKGETDSVKEEMQPFEEKVSEWLNYDVSPKYTFPWERTFEVKVNL